MLYIRISEHTKKAEYRDSRSYRTKMNVDITSNTLVKKDQSSENTERNKENNLKGEREKKQQTDKTMNCRKMNEKGKTNM